jgi:hypothetical protein
LLERYCLELVIQLLRVFSAFICLLSQSLLLGFRITKRPYGRLVYCPLSITAEAFKFDNYIPHLSHTFVSILAHNMLQLFFCVFNSSSFPHLSFCTLFLKFLTPQVSHTASFPHCKFPTPQVSHTATFPHPKFPTPQLLHIIPQVSHISSFPHIKFPTPLFSHTAIFALLIFRSFYYSS